MKNIKVILTAILFSFAFNAMAQDANLAEYKVNFSSGKLVLEDIDDVEIEGYSGTEIIFMSKIKKKKDMQRLEGMRMINNSGMTDNTGMGISITQEGGIVLAKQINNSGNSKKVKIKIPNTVSLYISHASHNADDIVIRNFTEELEITTNYHEVKLENVTGPMAVKTVYGGIESTFSQLSQRGSVSLYSVYSHVDITMPESTKADLYLSTSYGNVYSNADIKVTTEKVKGNDSCSNQFGTDIEGKLNGGGVELILKSSYENIYVRI